MAAISLLECGNCDMSSVNASGDVSLWQINKVHWGSTGGPSVLADPAASARAAYSVWKGAGGGTAGFRQWCTYPGGCGGASPVGWSTFNAKLTQVTASIQAAGGGVIPLPTPSDPGSDGGFDPTIPNIPLGPAGSNASGPIQAGTILGQPVGIPTGLVVGLLGVLIIIVGVIMFATNFINIGPIRVGESTSTNARGVTTTTTSTAQSVAAGPVRYVRSVRSRA